IAVRGQGELEEKGRETCRDHQRSEPALGPTPPRDQTRKDVRKHDPVAGDRARDRLARTVARQRKRERGTGCRASGSADRPEPPKPRRSSDTQREIRRERRTGHLSLLSDPRLPSKLTEPLRRDRWIGSARVTDERRRLQRGYSSWRAFFG